MLDLLKNIENVLLFTLWCISASLIVLSISVALWLCIRRLRRNARDAGIRERQSQFESYLQELLMLDTFPHDFELPADIRADRTAVTTGLLKFFKLVSGDDSLKLKIIVEKLKLEDIVTAHVTWGNRGKRMRAFHVLSFLDSRSSLKTISNYIFSSDKYIRLSVARCIARRQVLSLISEVAESISYAFPNDEKILADVLCRFGQKSIPRIESMARTNPNSTIVAGVLEALIILRPEDCDLDLRSFSEHEDERVRAAAVELSTIVHSFEQNDLLLQGLSDESRKVKIRALKVAAREKRKDCFADFYRLMNDPFMWVRYWAMRAALNTGQSGETLMRSISRQPTTVGDLANDVLMER